MAGAGECPKGTQGRRRGVRTMLVSPAEPPIFKTLGKSSPVPEKYGADFLTLSPTLGRVGIQRKEIDDLIASLGDRVPREISQLKGLDVGVWLIEGRTEWTSDGHLLSRTHSSFTKAQFLGTCWSLQSHGFWVVRTDSQTETIELLSLFDRWLSKDRHNSLMRRSATPTSVLGKPSLRDHRIHIMQGFQGIGYEKAAAIVDYYDGLPFSLSDVDLTNVPGVGPGIARRVKDAIG
jgi:ERCC4-type nuclease